MNSKKLAIIIGVFITGLVSCEEYEEYLNDYEFSAVYFATQKPLRTIVAYDEMKFKVGVALGGKRENNTEEWAKYEIDPTLLNDPDIMGGNTFTLLPSDYYTLSDAEMMVVPKGEFIGDVTVTLNREAFTSDPLAHQNTYALPLRLYETSADSILSGRFDEEGNQLVAPKNYTVLVVKYISPLHGTYYHKGVERELDDQGNVVNVTNFSNPDLSKNQAWSLETQALNEVSTSGAGTVAGNNSLKLTKNEDNTVTMEKVSGAITLIDGAGVYNEDEREFYLDYKYSLGGTDYSVTDTLILRQAPEKDLRFEEW
jgi:hypothetical protein